LPRDSHAMWDFWSAERRIRNSGDYILKTRFRTEYRRKMSRHKHPAARNTLPILERKQPSMSRTKRAWHTLGTTNSLDISKAPPRQHCQRGHKIGGGGGAKKNVRWVTQPCQHNIRSRHGSAAKLLRGKIVGRWIEEAQAHPLCEIIAHKVHT